MVDPEGELRMDIPERIVGERRQVDDRVTAREVRGLSVADVLLDRRHGRWGVAEQTVGEQGAVEADHRHARALKHRNHDGAEVTQMSRHQHPHATTSGIGIGNTKRPPQSRI